MDGFILNKYPATCYRCGGHVAPGEGDINCERSPALRWPQMKGTTHVWLVQHLGCKVKYNGTDKHYEYNP